MNFPYIVLFKPSEAVRLRYRIARHGCACELDDDVRIDGDVGMPAFDLPRKRSLAGSDWFAVAPKGERFREAVPPTKGIGRLLAALARAAETEGDRVAVAARRQIIAGSGIGSCLGTVGLESRP